MPDSSGTMVVADIFRCKANCTPYPGRLGNVAIRRRIRLAWQQVDATRNMDRGRSFFRGQYRGAPRSLRSGNVAGAWRSGMQALHIAAR